MAAHIIHKQTGNPSQQMGGRAPKLGAALQLRNSKTSSGQNDCRIATYTVEEVVAKQRAGILPRAADDGKREIVQRNEERNPNLHTPTYT